MNVCYSQWDKYLGVFLCVCVCMWVLLNTPTVHNISTFSSYYSEIIGSTEGYYNIIWKWQSQNLT